ncbi:MAG: glycosyl transferase family 1 [Rhizobiaceae bacterium]|nr:MAG: glycosyl transferase family 1 [Rhizobiaceae bacterium]
MLRILYFVHDLSDPAVRRRVMMLKAGGADVTLAGFSRANDIAEDVSSLAPLELGTTRDGAFAQRLLAVLSAASQLGARLKGVVPPDVIIGRNLEMLALACRARRLFGAEIPIVYECLDIHRLLLGTGGASHAVRMAERAFGRKAALLITSSPAFVRGYFRGSNQIEAPIALLYNKVLELVEKPEAIMPPAEAPQGASPWTIGWFGALRCRKSLEFLASFTRSMNGRFKVVLRGRPAYREFEDFDGFVEAQPFMRFDGPYRNPEDLAAIYGAVHFSWAIDFFEEGLNSRWLLPNRLFEGCRYGAVPIAMSDTETGNFLAERHLGIVLDQCSGEALAERLGQLDGASFEQMRNRIVNQDQTTWVCDLRDCRSLVARLASLASNEAPVVLAEALQ